MKKIEIERRFLLKRLPIINYHEIIDISQYYISDNGIKRLRSSLSDISGLKFEYIEKINVENGVNTEQDVVTFSASGLSEIAMFSEIAQKAFKSINKTRYIYNYCGHKFEVDLLTYPSLVLLEVELSDINQKINFPPDIEKEIIYEVTGIKEFSNFNLAENIQWKTN